MSNEYKKTFDDPRTARVLAAQFYVAKNLQRAPLHSISFIRNNRNYFPSITNETIEKIMKEHNITEEDLSKIKEVKFADINFEKNLRS